MRLLDAFPPLNPKNWHLTTQPGTQRPKRRAVKMPLSNPRFEILSLHCRN